MEVPAAQHSQGHPGKSTQNSAWPGVVTKCRAPQTTPGWGPQAHQPSLCGSPRGTWGFLSAQPLCITAWDRHWRSPPPPPGNEYQSTKETRDSLTRATGRRGPTTGPQGGARLPRLHGGWSHCCEMPTTSKSTARRWVGGCRGLGVTAHGNRVYFWGEGKLWNWT